MTGRFVGRGRELALLGDLLARAVGGDVQLALIGGMQESARPAASCRDRTGHARAARRLQAPAAAAGSLVSRARQQSSSPGRVSAVGFIGLLSRGSFSVV